MQGLIYKKGLHVAACGKVQTNLAEWQRRFPYAETHWFADAGHYLLEDIPDKIIARVKRFLNVKP